MENSQEMITFGVALFLGILFNIFSKKLKISPIVILLLGGIIVGPIGLNLIDPKCLGKGLKVIIQLAVALVLFEGGLTLNLKEYREVSSEIKKSLTIGVILTWLLSALTVKILFDLSWVFAILSGSLIIVTGPTVIGPLLKRIAVKKNIHGFLHWEGILIDPIGVFISLLCYEWIIGEDAILQLFFRLIVGIGIGLASGYLLSFIIKKRWISDEILNIFVLSSALLIFIISDILLPESGLMSVVIAGLVIGTTDTPQIDDLLIYKAQLNELLIGLLFILLASNLDINSFRQHYGIEMIIAVLIVMFVIRPINIFASTSPGSGFSLKEKLFLSWVAPRGIVAASMASLFALSLKAPEYARYSKNAEFLEAFTYSVILGTVIFQGFTAKWIGNILNVLEPIPTGWLIVGAHNIGIKIGQFIKQFGFDVVFLDTNMHSSKVAVREGFTSISDNAMTINPENYPEFYGIGNVLAITKNEDLNKLVCQRWSKLLNKPGLYFWRSSLQNISEKESEDRITIGKEVWSSIPINKIAETVLEPKDLIEININHTVKIKHPERLLMYYNEEKLLPFYPEKHDKSYKCLMYHPVEFMLDFNIKPEWIIYSKSNNMADAFRELLDCLKNDYPGIDTDEIHSTLITQEKEFPSVIGFNVSLPHAYIENLHGSVVLMAKMDQPIPCIYNQENIYYIFLLLSPKDHPKNHIEALSKISKFVLKNENRDAMKNAKSRVELLNVFFPEKVY